MAKDRQEKGWEIAFACAQDGTVYLRIWGTLSTQEDANMFIDVIKCLQVFLADDYEAPKQEKADA